MPEVTSNIQETLQRPYDRSTWAELLVEVFPNVAIFQSPQHARHIKPEFVNELLQIGSVRLEDGKNLAVFEASVSEKVDLARNRVALRELIAGFIDQGATHGVLCIFNSADPQYRFTFVSKQTEIDEAGQIVTSETNPRRFTYVLGPGESRRTAAQRFQELAAKKERAGIADVIDAFSVERLNKEFFDQYKRHYQAFVDHLLSQAEVLAGPFGITSRPGSEAYDKDCKAVRDWVKTMLGRIVFVHFIQKKGWMGCKPAAKAWKDGDPQFLKTLYDNSPNKGRFYSERLAPLFFDALNAPDRSGDIFALTGTKVPYLNGGLFDAATEVDGVIDFPALLFGDLLEFFAAYNFTIDENDPDESQVGIDPEMLGHIFENLLEENRKKGAYYTPKAVVQFMCQQTLLLYLEGELGRRTELETLVRRKDAGSNDSGNWIRQNASKIEQLLDRLTVCDPAIGSGAFPIGMLTEIFWIKLALDWTLNDPQTFAATKRRIIERTIHGVDIDPGAVAIARLRCWLALIVDETAPRPLPNLEFNIFCADSLVDYLRGEPINLSRLAKDEHTGAIVARLISAKTEFFEAASRPAKRKALTLIYEAITALAQYEFSWLRTEEGLFSDSSRVAELDSATSEIARVQKRIAELPKMPAAKQDAALEEIRRWFEDKAKPTFLWQLHFGEIFAQSGFDVVIANPPYVRQEAFTAVKPLLRQLYSTFTGTADIYTFFFEKAHSLLKEGGCLTFITSDKFHRSDYGEKLRAFLSRKCYIAQLVDFRDVSVFEALAYASILCAKKAAPTNDACISMARWVRDKSIQSIQAALPELTFQRRQTDYAEGKWTVETEKENRIFAKMVRSGKPIQEFADTKFYYGIKTGLNEAFVVDAATADRIASESSSAEKILRPFVEGKSDLERWCARQLNQRLLLLASSENTTHPWSGLSDADAERKFASVLPSVYRFLQPFKAKLKRRSDQGTYYWELRSCTYWSAFEKPKIIIPTLSSFPVAVWDTSGVVSNDKTTIVACSKPAVLVALLHSAAVWWQLTRIAAIRQNSFYEVKDMYLKELVLPNLNAQSELKLSAIASEAIAQERRCGSVDAALLENLNKLVNSLWELTSDEARIIRSAISEDFVALAS
jgi:hypothetical protein